MFGARIDYLLLKPLAHSRNRATEEELDREGCSSLTVEQMAGKLETVLQRFDGHFPISPDLRYLDMGCGSGELTLGLARLGARRITGVDFLPRFIHKARDNARAANLPSVEFVCADLHDWRPAQPFDVVISFDALEHIDRPKEFLATMSRFLAPGGIAAISFGPLFHSPFGDHMYEFFKLQIPWRGALFSEQAMLRLRKEFYRPTDPATAYREIAGGLNLMRYSEFLRFARETGWRFQYLRTNTFLKSGPLRKLSERVCKTPVLQDYFVHNVYAVMQRAEARQSSIDTRADDLPLAA
jgi:SAM-dependent methyltransferase